MHDTSQRCTLCRRSLQICNACQLRVPRGRATWTAAPTASLTTQCVCDSAYLGGSILHRRDDALDRGRQGYTRGCCQSKTTQTYACNPVNFQHRPTLEFHISETECNASRFKPFFVKYKSTRVKKYNLPYPIIVGTAHYDVKSQTGS